MTKDLTMRLLTQQHRDQLIANGKKNPDTHTIRDNDFEPVVKLYSETSAATWLLTEIDARDPDIAWGLCDVGDGKPEFGSVSLKELEQRREALDVGVKRLDDWKAKGKISGYLAAAITAGHIVELEDHATA
jgi:Protein of unknown function (DUF2958)